jgi:hypothetical protein
MAKLRSETRLAKACVEVRLSHGSLRAEILNATISRLTALNWALISALATLLGCSESELTSETISKEPQPDHTASGASTGVVTAASPSGTSASYIPMSSTLRPATDDETRRFLTNGPRDFHDGPPDRGAEWFPANGTYRREPYGVTGRYTVTDNLFCVTETGNEKYHICRQLFVGPEGPFYRLMR